MMSLPAAVVGQTGEVIRCVVIGRGWIGAAVTESLGADVVGAIDVPGEPWLAKRDAAATSEIRRLVRALDATTVINTAGRLAGTPQELSEANVALPGWLVSALAGTGVRLLHVGSASEYGDPGGSEPLSESAPLRASGAYGETKLAGSDAVRAARADGMDAAVARVFNPVGPGVRRASPLGDWLAAVAELPPTGGVVTLFEADMVRDFVALHDVGRALASLAQAPELPPVVNVCSGVGLRYGDIASELIRRRGVEARVESLGRGGIMSVIGDNTLLGDVVGWTPSMSVSKLADVASL